ncbi:MAG: 50S ribosomal protein L25/general stress protein Ctc [Bernardetiaceae bacterium]
MKTVDIIGYYRHDLGRKTANALRQEGHVPCVLYGTNETIHFYTPMILFRELVYSPDACKVRIDIEGDIHEAILQETQFHPVNEIIMHADFLKLKADKKVKMDIPIKLIGRAKGVERGGDLMPKVRYVRVKALPKDMPEVIEVDVTALDLGKSIKVKEVKAENYEILTSKDVSLASIVIPRALRGTLQKESAEA